VLKLKKNYCMKYQNILLNNEIYDTIKYSTTTTQGRELRCADMDLSICKSGQVRRRGTGCGMLLLCRCTNMTAVWKVHWLTLLLQVGTLRRCADSLFYEVPPLASDALLTMLHPLLENMLQTVNHFKSSYLRAPWKSPEITGGEIWTVWQMF
jgi:hypothetical protein